MGVRLWIESIRFNSGDVVRLSPGAILVVVGPNNAGKTALLRELYSRTQESNSEDPGQICADVTFAQEGTPDEFLEWVEANFEKRQRLGDREPSFWGFEMVHSQGTIRHVWEAGNGVAFQALKASVCTLADAKSRLNAAVAPDAINFATDAISHPIHLLYTDERAERLLSSAFRKAFGQDLVVNRSAGRTVPLMCGDAPIPAEGEDRLSMPYLRRVNAMTPLERQGDGMNSFVGCLLALAVPSRFVVMIDEPEAFLHPPQARMLGAVLAAKSSTSQVIVATHSGDILRGLLDAGHDNIHVIRIRRTGTLNTVAELEPGDISKIWEDSILRFSNVLDGLFHERVIVCESDSDCRFYSALVDAQIDADADATRPDLMFASSGGKHRMPTVVSALTRLGVPASVVADFDLLNAEQPLRSIFEILGGDWSRIAADWRLLKATLETKTRPLTSAQVKQDIAAVINGVTTSAFPDDAIEKIRLTLKAVSPWAAVKSAGLAGIPSGQPTEAARRLLAALRNQGLFIVDCGEVERFVPSIGGHGPSWVSAALDRDITADPEFAAARKFAADLIAYQEPNVEAR